jgi:hypothetical protein
MRKHEDFRQLYAIAKEVQLEGYADETIEIADDQSEDVNRSRLRVDTRKWHLSKLLPKRYGDLIGKYEAPTQAENQPMDVMQVARAVAVILSLASRTRDATDIEVK